MITPKANIRPSSGGYAVIIFDHIKVNVILSLCPKSEKKKEKHKEDDNVS